MGVVASLDLAKEGEPSHARFPMVGTYTGFVTFAHSEAVKGTGLPTMPYIIDSREVEEEGLADLELPSSMELKEVIYNLFSGVMGPHLKSSMDKLREVLGGDWRKAKAAKWSFPKLMAEGGDGEERGAAAGENDELDERGDDSGDHGDIGPGDIGFGGFP